MKIISMTLFFLLSSITYSMAVDADGFLRIPGEAVGNDEKGVILICPSGTHPVRNGCEDYLLKKKVKGEYPSGIINRMIGSHVRYVGFTADGRDNGAVVLYYKLK